AGVSMSDHEVNIKILLDLLMREGRLNRVDRNELLAGMSDEVAELVLADNVHQARALTLDGIRSAARHDDFLVVLDHLVASGAASRADGLPSRDDLLARPDRERGVPRSVLATAMALAKNWGRAALGRSPLVGHPLTQPLLISYFPSTLRDRWVD